MSQLKSRSRSVVALRGGFIGSREVTPMALDAHGATDGSLHRQYDPPTTRATIHVAMGLDHLVERIHLDDLWRQQLVGRELVDIA